MVVIAEVLGQVKWLQISFPEAQSLADFAAFDSASRGPLGSLSLFYLWKPQPTILLPMIYTAYLITIAALAMGPFTQQIILIQSGHLVPWEGLSSAVTVSNYFNSDSNPNTGVDLEVWISENGTIEGSLTAVGVW